MSRWVLLRHELPDRTWHYDWMLDADEHPSPHSEARLITFRTLARPDDPTVRSFDAERIADHRRAFLTYEGPLANDRGSVSRIAEGECRVEVLVPIVRVVMLVGFDQRELVRIGTRQDSDGRAYRFVLG